MNTVAVSISSNIQPLYYVSEAIKLIAKDYKVLAVSTFCFTKPIGYIDQPDYLNGSILVSTNLSMQDFDNYLKQIENSLGRERTDNKNSPRTIDLDIIIWKTIIVNNDYYERDFLQLSISEIMPEINKAPLAVSDNIKKGPGKPF